MLTDLKIIRQIQVYFFVLGAVCSNAQANFEPWIKADLAGFVLENAALYPDSSFFDNPVGVALSESIVRIRRRTNTMHDDDAQKQQFYWYYVQTNKGQKGWIFGDQLAASVPTRYLPPGATKIHKKKYTFDPPLDESIMWFASVNGQDFLNGTTTDYQELFLLITKPSGKTNLMIVGHQNPYSKSVLDSMDFAPVSSLDANDFIFYQTRIDSSSSTAEIQVKKQVRAEFETIFRDSAKVKSLTPYLGYKKYFFEPPMIRSEYCRGTKKPIDQTIEKAHRDLIFLRLGSATHFYQATNNSFDSMYKNTETSLRGRAKKKIEVKTLAGQTVQITQGTDLEILGFYPRRGVFLATYDAMMTWVPIKEVSVFSDSWP